MAQNRLYNLLGPDKAPYAVPVMLEGGSVEWRNYSDGCRGAVGKFNLMNLRGLLPGADNMSHS